MFESFLIFLIFLSFFVLGLLNSNTESGGRYPINPCFTRIEPSTINIDFFGIQY